MFDCEYSLKYSFHVCVSTMRFKWGVNLLTNASVGVHRSADDYQIAVIVGGSYSPSIFSNYTRRSLQIIALTVVASLAGKSPCGFEYNL
jgi:hypothetical protein